MNKVARGAAEGVRGFHAASSAQRSFQLSNITLANLISINKINF